MTEQTNKANRKTGAPAGPRKTKQKRAFLIETASSLFISKGYDKTSMDEIAEAADCAKGTLYHYFKNKEELLGAIRAGFENEVMSRIIPRVESCPEKDWKKKIETWIDAAVEAYFELSELHDVAIYGSGMPFRNSMTDAEITKYLMEIIENGNKAGVWDIEDAHWTATIMFYSFRGGCDEAMVGSVSVEVVPEKLKKLFRKILNI